MPLALPAIADSEDMLTADMLAALVPGEPSRKNAEGEKLPGVKPECTDPSVSLDEPLSFRLLGCQQATLGGNIASEPRNTRTHTM